MKHKLAATELVTVCEVMFYTSSRPTKRLLFSSNRDLVVTKSPGP